MWSMATARVMLFNGPQAKRYTENVLYTQGSAHERRSVETVMLLKGPQAGWFKQAVNAVQRVRLFKGAHARQYTQHVMYRQVSAQKRSLYILS